MLTVAALSEGQNLDDKTTELLAKFVKDRQDLNPDQNSALTKSNFDNSELKAIIDPLSQNYSSNGTVQHKENFEISRLTHEEISADLQKLTQEISCMSLDQELDLLTKLRLRLRDILESSLDNIADPIDAYSSQPTNKSTKISDSPISSDSDSTTEFITDADMRYADSLGLSLTRSTAHAYEDNEERDHLKECPSPSNNSLPTPSEVPISTLPQMETVDLDHHRHASLAESEIAAHRAHHLITEAQQQPNFGSLTIASPRYVQFGIGATENSPNAFSDLVALNSTLKFTIHGTTHEITGNAAIMLEFPIDSEEWSTIWNVLHDFHSRPPAASTSSQISEEAEDSDLTAPPVNDQSEIVISEPTEHAEVQLPGNPLNDENQPFLSLSATTTFDDDPLVGDFTFDCHPLLGTASNEVSPVSTFVPALVAPVVDQIVRAELSSGRISPDLHEEWPYALANNAAPTSTIQVHTTHIDSLSSQQAFAIFNDPLLYKPNSRPPPSYVNLPPLKPTLPWPDEPSLPPPVVFDVTGGHVSAVRPSQHDPKKEERLVLGNARRYAPPKYSRKTRANRNAYIPSFSTIVETSNVVTYGPFPPVITGYPRASTLPHEYRIFLSVTPGYDPTKLFGFGSALTDIIEVAHYPLSPFPVDPVSLSPMELDIVEDISALYRDERPFPCGVWIPEELMTDRWPTGVDAQNHFIFRLPTVERLIALAIHWSPPARHVLPTSRNSSSSTLPDLAEYSPASFWDETPSSGYTSFLEDSADDEDMMDSYLYEDQSIRLSLPPESSPSLVIPPIECQVSTTTVVEAADEAKIALPTETNPLALLALAATLRANEANVQNDNATPTNGMKTALSVSTMQTIAAETPSLANGEIPIEGGIDAIPVSNPIQHDAESPPLEYASDSPSTHTNESTSGSQASLRIRPEDIGLDSRAGILAYGPRFDLRLPSARTDDTSQLAYMHHIYLYPTLLVLATEEIGYGMYPSTTSCTIFRPIPKSPIPIQPPFHRYNEFAHELFEQVNTYLNTSPESLEGIPIPIELMQDAQEDGINPENGSRRFFLPHVEYVLSKILTHLIHPLLNRPHPRLELFDIQRIVSPAYPTRFENDPLNLRSPILPLYRVQFAYSEDNAEGKPPLYYSGCLSRQAALRFDKIQPAWNDVLYFLLNTTFETLLLHSTSPRGPSGLQAEPEIDWDNVTAPHQAETLLGVDPREEDELGPLSRHLSHFRNNHWFRRIHFLVACRRQLNLAIRHIDFLFQALQFEDFVDAVRILDLNTHLDFNYSPFLTEDEAIFLTAAYDFFLREHKTSLANSFLAILHLPFPHSLELEAVKTRILDTIEPCLTEGRFDDYKII
jgi:hypothetical protein